MPSRSDNFDRVDTTNAIGTPSDGGSAWQQLSGTWGISSNTGYNSVGGSQEICVLESSAAIVTVEVTISTFVNDMGVILRCTDNNNYLLFGVATDTFGFKRVAGTFTQILTNATVFITGDVLKVTVDASNLFSVYKNGAFVASVTEAFNTTATLHGLRTNASAAGRFNDFSITAPTTTITGLGQKHMGFNYARPYL